MKRLSAVLILACFTVTHLAAQDTGERNFKRFGFKLGANYALMNFNKGFPRPAVHVAQVWKPGITAGFFMEVPVINKLSVRPEYAFARMRGEDTRIHTGYNLDYLSMPVLLKYTLSKSVAVLAGPQFDLLIKASQHSNGVKTGITHNTEERNLGAVAGMELQLTGSFYLEARYMYGISHIGLGQRSNTTEFVYRLVQVSMDYKF